MNRTALLAVVAGLALTTAAVSGETKGTPIQQYRHTFFETLGGHMKQTGMNVKGVVDRKTDLLTHAEALHGSAVILPTLFPEGSGEGSRALPKIWEDKAGFEKAAKRFEDESAKLVELAKAKDWEAFKGQYMNVGKSCGGCHDGFRAEEE